MCCVRWSSAFNKDRLKLAETSVQGASDARSLALMQLGNFGHRIGPRSSRWGALCCVCWSPAL
eukprot:6828130-Alexandrium_andersonii.AAC.1